MKLSRNGRFWTGWSWEQAEQKQGRRAKKSFMANNPSLRPHNSAKANMSKVLTSVSEDNLMVKGVIEKSREQ